MLSVTLVKTPLLGIWTCLGIQVLLLRAILSGQSMEQVSRLNGRGQQWWVHHGFCHCINCALLFQMWACALGHMDAAVVLYKWDRRAISIPDSLGRLPLAIARSRGHVKLAECLEQLQRDEQVQLGQNPRIQCPSSGESNMESWVSQWHSDIITSQEPPKGVTVISSSSTGKNNPKG